METNILQTLVERKRLPGKVYIAGKITGMEKEAFLLFEKAEKHLKNIGFETVNPMKLPHKHDKKWQSFMDECLPALKECEFIFLLKNWKDSKGAKIEVLNAVNQDKIIIKEV